MSQSEPPQSGPVMRSAQEWISDVVLCFDIKEQIVNINIVEKVVRDIQLNALASRPAVAVDEGDVKACVSFLENMLSLSDWEPTKNAYELCLKVIRRACGVSG